MIGDVADVTRFPAADKVASYNGTGPIEASSGRRKTCRLSMRGNRRLNHAIHMAAVTQTALARGRLADGDAERGTHAGDAVQRVAGDLALLSLLASVQQRDNE